MKFSAFAIAGLVGVAADGGIRKTYVEPAQEERRVWIRYNDGQRDETLRSLGSFSARSLPPVTLHHEFPGVDSVVVTATVDEINELSLDPAILEIVEDPKRYPQHITESIQPRKLQGDGEEIPYGIEMVQATTAHSLGYTGLGAKVCVVDTGIDYGHEDFVTSRLTGFESSNSELQWKEDVIGHGTHCSGTIAAARNGKGVVGVAPDAEVYTVKVFGSNGAFAFGSSILAAVEECQAAGFNIVSMSLGGPFPNILEWFAYQNLLEDGVLSIAAAGNSGNSANSYPGSYPGVVSVAAVDSDMEVASFSQRNRNVDIAAPGVDVLSTFPTNGCQICDRLDVVQYGVISGTSMATPHVAGVAGLLRAQFPDVPASEIAAVLISSAMDLGDPGRDNSYGAGLVQAVAALEALNGGPIGGNPNPGPPTPGPPTPWPPSGPPGQCGSDFLKLDIALATDQFGSETYWSLARDRDQYPVAFGTQLASESTYDYFECLPSDCYTFTLFDSRKDGLCCEFGEGSYSITVDDILLGESEPFESQISYSFGTCATDSPPKEPRPACVDISAVVRTDSYPAETTLSLVDESDGAQIWSRAFDQANTVYDDMKECVNPSGCFTFTIDDSYEDGLCCVYGSGYVTLTYDGETVISESEAGFGDSLSVSVGNCA